jgi:hypothetical protein
MYTKPSTTPPARAGAERHHPGVVGEPAAGCIPSVPPVGGWGRLGRVPGPKFAAGTAAGAAGGFLGRREGKKSVGFCPLGGAHQKARGRYTLCSATHRAEGVRRVRNGDLWKSELFAKDLPTESLVPYSSGYCRAGQPCVSAPPLRLLNDVLCRFSCVISAPLPAKSPSLLLLPFHVWLALRCFANSFCFCCSAPRLYSTSRLMMVAISSVHPGCALHPVHPGCTSG